MSLSVSHSVAGSSVSKDLHARVDATSQTHLLTQILQSYYILCTACVVIIV